MARNEKPDPRSDGLDEITLKDVFVAVAIPLGAALLVLLLGVVLGAPRT